MNYILPIHCGSPDMAKLNLGSIYLKIDKDIDLSLYLDAKKSSIAKLLPLKNTITITNTNTNINTSNKIRLPLAQNQKQSRFLNKGCLMSFCDSFSPQAPCAYAKWQANVQGSQGKTEANIQDKNKNKNLNSYLAGLFEGDGHIWLPNINWKKKHNPRFCITFALKNEPLAKKILEIIEYGHIRYKPKENACVLIVSPVKGLKKIIWLINGELRTPKVHQLHKLIDWINVNHSSNIIKKSVNKESNFNNSWLAGFVDADGSFGIRHTNNKAKKRQISCRLRIEQRMVDPITNESYFDILNKIAFFFNCNLLLRKQVATGNVYFSLTASSSKSIKIIIDYFECYPLYSSKYLDYKDWAEAARLILDKKQYESIVKIDSLKSNMNNSRVYFNWIHLNKLT
jgi:LAGLIDADG endonuclease